jgi:hypothetical protein
VGLDRRPYGYRIGKHIRFDAGEVERWLSAQIEDGP